MANFEKRELKNGQTVHRVRVRLKGHPVEIATFYRLTDAKKWAASIESSIREGRHFKTAEAKRHTLSETIDRYRKSILPHKSPSMERDQWSQLQWWKQHLGDRSLADVTSTIIAEHKDKLSQEKGERRKKRSPATVNRYLSALSHVFTIDVKEWGWIEENPLRKVGKRKEPRGRVRFLSDDERVTLLAACQESEEPYLYPIVVLALSTGARKGEILNLEWSDIDLQRKVAILHETKNDERRALPLAERCLEVVRELNKTRRIDTRYLFPSVDGKKPVEIRQPWEEAVKKAKLKNFRFHDLRHSAASYLAMNGASLAEIAEVLGHKTLQMVQRYTHLTEQHTHSVVSRMNKKIFGG